VQKPSCTLICR
jgi:hypothetical protein